MCEQYSSLSSHYAASPSPIYLVLPSLKLKNQHPLFKHPLPQYQRIIFTHTSKHTHKQMNMQNHSFVYINTHIYENIPAQ